MHVVHANHVAKRAKSTTSKRQERKNRERSSAMTDVAASSSSPVRVSAQHAALAATIDAEPRPETPAQALSALQTLHEKLRNALALERTDDTQQLVTDAHDALAHWLTPAPRSSATTATLASKPLPLVLWLECLRVGSCLLLAQSRPSDDSTESATAVARVHALVVTARPPLELPSATAHCAASEQIAFSCNVWDALVGSAVSLLSSATSASSSSAHQLERVLSLLLDAYAHWMSAAMSGFAVAFIATTRAALQAHIAKQQQQQVARDRDVWRTLCSALLTKLDDASLLEPPQWRASAPATAVALLVLDSLDTDVSQRDTALHARVLAQLQHRIVSKLRAGAFPHVHEPASVVSMALCPSHERSAMSPVDASAVLVELFALLRRMSLPLLSLRLSPVDNHQALTAAAQTLAQRLSQAVSASVSGSETAELAFHMLEASVNEATQQLRSSSIAYSLLVRALATVYAPDLLNEDTLALQSDSDFAGADSVAPSAADDTHATLAYLETLYSSVSALLRVLTETPAPVHDTRAVLRAFVVLSRLEFARESCASAETNALMHALTQRVEDAIEQPSEQHHVLTTLLQSVSVARDSSSETSDAWATPARTTASSESAIPLDSDVIFGTQALAVGVIIQRKLRVVLFREPALVDDALALVFRGVWSAYAPLSAFAQSFLAFCLTHLGHYVSVYRIAPFYLQLTLRAFPARSGARQSLAKSCGVIFGAFFFASAEATDSVHSSGSTPTQAGDALSPQQRMAVWAMRQCCARVQELVLAPVVTTTSSSSGSSESHDEDAVPPQSSSEESPLASGLLLAGIAFEVLKMSPLVLLAPLAVEVERLVSACTAHARAESSKSAIAATSALVRQLFASISQHCEAAKRAWLAAWYVELTQLYALDDVVAAGDSVQSRL